MTRVMALGEVGSYFNGKAFKPSDWSAEGLPIIRIVNLNDASAPFNYFLGEVRAEQLVDDGDLLVSWSASLDAYIWQGGPAVLNQHIFKVYEQPDVVDRTYLWYALRSVMRGVRAQVHGATMQHITKPEFEAISIPVPQMDVQRRIAAELTERLGAVDRMRAEIDASRAAILAAKDSAWNATVGSRHSSSTTRRRLREVADSIDYGWTARAVHDADGPLFLRITDIQGGRVDWNSVPRAGNSIPATKMLRHGDIVVARSGATSGKSFLLASPPEAGFASYLLRVRLNDQARPEFVAAWMNSPDYWSQVSQAARGGAQPNLNATQLASFTLPALPPHEQETLMARLGEQMAAIDTMEKAARSQSMAIDALPAAMISSAFGDVLA